MIQNDDQDEHYRPDEFVSTLETTRDAITASMLYNYVQCPHRVYLDLYGDSNDKDEESSFVELLWERGNAFEAEVIRNLGFPYTDLSHLRGDEKEEATMRSMHRGDECIYSGRIRHGNLLGEPDILRRSGAGYVAGDIKSGSGDEGSGGDEEGRLKTHYAVQLSLYTDILERHGLSPIKRPFVWDVHGREVPYPLDAAAGIRERKSLWAVYRDVLKEVEAIQDGRTLTRPAYASPCRLCHWKSFCRKTLEGMRDLTLVPELGRSKRERILHVARTFDDLARLDPGSLIQGRKSLITGIGAESIRKFILRSRLLATQGASPVLTGDLDLPESQTEVFFDLETDPMRDICYLHGFLVRKKNTSGETYVGFFADTPTHGDEEAAFLRAWSYIRSLQPCTIYIYSKYERTVWRRLQKRYPAVVSFHEVEDLFSSNQCVDLLSDAVKSKTEWPTYDHSIKTLATYLGFTWRDTDPSGASSIQWYHRWVETQDPSLKKRILEYNEDDCIATRILLDALRRLQAKGRV
ncbi:MAG: TM0106 family RecB-like putative nuclease [Desulfomonilia bacterium]